MEFYEKRLNETAEKFKKIFGNSNKIRFFSAPGRTEIGGNHTDHQHGCVLAASINLDIIAATALNGKNEIRVQSDGYPLDIIKLDELNPDKNEFNQSKALIRGIAAKFKELGCNLKGFDCYTTSNVLKGSGLSSSAAFEVLLGNIINRMFFDNKVSDIDIAKIGQYAENIYFGKPCGLMDQMASSVGGIIFIDFKDSENPLIRKINFDFQKNGYTMCIIDTGANHADLTDEYAAIPYEMKQIAHYFKKEYLRDIKKEDFIKEIPDLRKIAGDRAVLRALHFFNENQRALEEALTLENGDFQRFLKLIKQSGYSSYMYLQNVCVCGSSKEQAVALILGLCDEILKDKGAYRVHGGGFAGTVQAFVPIEMTDEFKLKIERIAGQGNCHILSIRQEGGIEVKYDL